MNRSFNYESDSYVSTYSNTLDHPRGSNDKNGWYFCTLPDCGKMYKYKSQLKRHAIVHSTEKPHSCPFEGCTKAFKRIDNLKAHIHSHTEEKPFYCKFPDCKYSFVNRSSLHHHSFKHEKKEMMSGSNEGIIKETIKSKVKSGKISEKDTKTNESCFKIQDTIKYFLMSTNVQEIRNHFQSLYEKYQKENNLLKQTLDMYSELRSHQKQTVKSYYQEEDILFRGSLEKRMFYDEQETKFLDFLKEKEHENSENSHKYSHDILSK